MPTPIIDLQRRLALVGAVRAGGEKPDKGVGRKLEAYRLTSPRKHLLEQAAQLYGGTVSKWKGPVGDEWQVYTEAEELPVLVMPGYSLQQSYELWEGATKRTRKCDGIEEDVSGGACLCEQEGDTKCDIYTRLVVALPELDTALGWRLITRGANAAHELPTMMALIDARAGGASFVPARIRIDHRRGVKDGQVVRFVVPVLDLGLSYLQLAGHPGSIDATPALPASDGLPYQTATREPGGTSDALQAVTGPRTGPSDRRPPLPQPQPSDYQQQAPTPEGGEAPAAPKLTPEQEAHALLFGDDTPPQTPQPPAPGEPDPFGERFASEPKPEPKTQTKDPTLRQIRNLDRLVGTLRDAGHITTDGVYTAIAERLRDKGGLELALELGGYDENHVLHWSPLRDSLTRVEADQLIDWLKAKEKQVAEASK